MGNNTVYPYIFGLQLQVTYGPIPYATRMNVEKFLASEKSKVKIYMGTYVCEIYLCRANRQATQTFISDYCRQK